MILRIRSRDGLERLVVDHPNATVGHLRALVHSQLGVPMTHQTLSMNYNLLLAKTPSDLSYFTDMSDPGTPLSALNLSHGSVVYIFYDRIDRTVPGPGFNPAGSFGRKMTIDDLLAKERRLAKRDDKTLSFAVNRGDPMQETVQRGSKDNWLFCREPEDQKLVGAISDGLQKMKLN